MPNLQIPDYLEGNLEASAAKRGITTEALIEQVLNAHIEQEFPAPETFTDAEIARFKQSSAQLDRGEVVTSEEVEKRFEEFFARQAARQAAQ